MKNQIHELVLSIGSIDSQNYSTTVRILFWSHELRDQ